jgi:DNA-binding IclR family transcriptional regulator
MQSESKLLSLLHLFSKERPTWSRSEIQKATKIPFARLDNYLAKLSNEGLLTSYIEDYYSLGPGINELYIHYKQGDPLWAAGRVAFSKLCGPSYSLPEAELSIFGLYQSTIMCVDSFHSAYLRAPQRFSAGERHEHSQGAAPRAILAYLDPLRAARLLAKSKELTKKRSRKIPESELEEIRQKGYAFWYRPNKYRLYELAVPIYLPNGNIAGSFALVAKFSKFSDGQPDPELVKDVILGGKVASFVLAKMLPSTEAPGPASNGDIEADRFDDDDPDESELDASSTVTDRGEIDRSDDQAEEPENATE